jgi:hypothetical protein
MNTLRQSFEDIHRGTNNAYKIAVIPKGTEYQETGQNPKDMDFSSLSKDNRDKITSGFGVPKTVLGNAEESTNRSTAETAIYVFAKFTLEPIMEQIVQHLNAFLVPRFGDDIYLKFVSPVPDDRTQEIEELKAALAGQATMTINEARERYFGLSPIQNGDKVLTSFASIGLGGTEGEKKVGRPARTPAGKVAREGSARKKLAVNIKESLAKAFKEATEKTVEAKKKAIETGGKGLTEDQWGLVYKAFRARVTEAEKNVHSLMKKWNGDNREEVLKRLENRMKSGAKALSDNLFDEKEWEQILIDLVTPVMKTLYLAEGKEALLLLGITDYNPTEAMMKHLDRAIKLMSKSYTETTLALLKHSISVGLEEGTGFDAVASKVKEVYEFSDDARALSVARTETFRAANMANKDAWKSTGRVVTIKWYTAEDELVCEYCGPMNGKTVGIEENFFDKGDSVRGADGGVMDLSYANVEAGALHPNCRCYTRPDEIKESF